MVRFVKTDSITGLQEGRGRMYRIEESGICSSDQMPATRGFERVYAGLAASNTHGPSRNTPSRCGKTWCFECLWKALKVWKARYKTDRSHHIFRFCVQLDKCFGVNRMSAADCVEIRAGLSAVPNRHVMKLSASRWRLRLRQCSMYSGFEGSKAINKQGVINHCDAVR